MIPSIEQLEQACDAIDGLRWYGRYSGRFHFDGYAVIAESPASLTELFMALDGMPMPDHQDQMGFDRLFAWSRTNWMPKRYVGHKFRTLNAG
jgi:hypothetical protein